MKWDERFDEEFADYGGEYHDQLDAPIGLVKDFVRKELSTLAQAFFNVVPKDEKEPEHAGYTAVEASMYGFIRGRNEALQATRSALKKIAKDY
jgi:hypothetical protein